MGAGVDEVRAYCQPQDRQGARSRRAALTAWTRRQGDRIEMPFAAAHESVHGTKRTWLILQAMSDLGGIAEVALRRWVRKNRDQKGLFDRTKRLFVSFISACWWRFRSSSSNSRMISRDRSDSIITNSRWRSGFISSGRETAV